MKPLEVSNGIVVIHRAALPCGSRENRTIPSPIKSPVKTPYPSQVPLEVNRGSSGSNCRLRESHA